MKKSVAISSAITAGQGDLLSHSLSARLIPAYGFGVVRLSVEPNRFTFVQSRAQISVIFIGENEVRTASEIHYGRIDDA